MRNPYLSATIPKLYQRQTFDAMLYAFIEAYRLAQPTVTTTEAASAFITHFDIKDYDIKTAIMTHLRMTKELFDEKRTKDP